MMTDGIPPKVSLVFDPKMFLTRLRLWCGGDRFDKGFDQYMSGLIGHQYQSISCFS